MLSSAARRGGLQACSIHQRRQLSTTSSSRLVLSRRAWQAHSKTLPAKPKPKAKKDDKPWPREYQIAGYAACAIFIPYSFLWFALSSLATRDQLEAIAPGLVDNPRLRMHFGELEWDAQAYGDKGEELGPEYYHYPGEIGLLARQNEITVQERNAQQVETNLHLQYGGTSSVETKTVSSSTLANPESLKQAFDVSKESDALVAIDFPKDDESHDSKDGEFTLSDQLSTDFVEPDPALKIRRERHTFSSWHYIPTLSAEEKKEQAKNKNRMSDVDLEIARLEYTLEELEKDLKDPTCTKDIDTMNEDRSKARSELRKLKWRRRLGMN